MPDAPDAKGEDKSSLTHHETSRIRFSQMVIVVLLVVGILISVIVGLPESWKKATDNTASNFKAIVEEGKLAGSDTSEGINKILEGIDELQALTPEEIAEQEEVIIPEPQTVTATTRYVNYDWNIGMELPAGWSFDGSSKALSSENRNMTVVRIEEFILPSHWISTTDTPTSSHLYFKDEDTKEFHAIIDSSPFTYIFTTTSTDAFTNEEKKIIHSLKAYE